MINSSTITAIAQLLGSGRSLRSIAKEFRVSFATVAKVARGEFKPTHERCADCGAKVKSVSVQSQRHSCLACALRSDSARR